MLGRIVDLLGSKPVFALACVVAIPVTLFRLFGVLFFASTISSWAVVPAIATVGLVAVACFHGPVRAYGGMALLVAYLCSVYFHGWPSLMNRLAEGQDAVFDVTEAAVIAILVLQCLLPRPRVAHLTGDIEKHADDQSRD